VSATGGWCATAAIAALLLLVPIVPAQAKEGVRFSATLDSREIGSLNANRPLKLSSDRPLEVSLSVTNDSTEDVTVRSVRLESKVIGLAFFAYETRLDLKVARGTTEQRRFPVETLDLSDQATGLLPARITLLDAERDHLAERRFAADVDGSLLSIYGVFAILVIAITAVLVAAILIRLAARRLAPNRWRRAVRFGTAGVGIGLSLTFSLSALRLLLPDASRWLPLVLVSAAALFVVGYLTPAPYHDVLQKEDSDEVLASTTGGKA
jgi:hypothetical protein